jgi:hypothetical protein
MHLMAYDIEHSASIGDILQGYVHYDKFEWPEIKLEYLNYINREISNP